MDKKQAIEEFNTATLAIELIQEAMSELLPKAFTHLPHQFKEVRATLQSQKLELEAHRSMCAQFL